MFLTGICHGGIENFERVDAKRAWGVKPKGLLERID